MDLEGIWSVIKVYNISFSIFWGLPLYSNSLTKRHHHIPRTSAHYRLWLILVGTGFHFGSLCSILILLWLNFLRKNPLTFLETFATIGAFILATAGCCFVLGVNEWMEIATTTATRLQKDYSKLTKGIPTNFSAIHQNIGFVTICQI